MFIQSNTKPITPKTPTYSNNSVSFNIEDKNNNNDSKNIRLSTKLPSQTVSLENQKSTDLLKQKRSREHIFFDLAIRNTNIVTFIFIIELLSYVLYSPFLPDYSLTFVGFLKSLLLYMTYAMGDKLYDKICVCHGFCYICFIKSICCKTICCSFNLCTKKKTENDE